jgi:hypothetical protein
MGDVYVLLAADPPQPSAGKTFKVTATLADGPASEALTITFEKHRVNVDTSGRHDLCPILEGYFVQGGYPNPIKLKKGEQQGSTNVEVSAKAKNPPCPDPGQLPPYPAVTFPDRLLLTAFVTKTTDPGGNPIGREHIALTIRPN